MIEDIELRRLIKKYNFRPNKKMGQNFLLDRNILQRITNAVLLNNNSVVIEIGTGMGNLTRYLCQKAKFVYTVEKDPMLCKIASDSLSNFKNLKIVCDDILEVDLRELLSSENKSPDAKHKFKVVGNIPYYITTAIIFRLLKQRQYCDEIFLTVQNELAHRIIASPGTKDYGVLSCSVQFYAAGEILFKINKNVFYPHPEVDSAFIKIKLSEHPAITIKDEKGFLKFIKMAFSHRRKTLLNSLCSKTALGLPKDIVKDMLDSLKVDYKRRPETLTLNEFARIYNYSTK